MRNGRMNFSLFRRPDAVRRAGQTRSTPICAACLLELKEVGDYDRATVRGAVKRSRVTTIIKGGDPAAIAKYFQTMKTKRTTDPEEAAALEEGTRVRLVRTPDGATLILPNYMDYEATPTDSTDSGYEPFIMTRLKKIANAWQLPFEVAYQIWQDANFARARIHYLREGATANRWRSRMASGFANNTWGLHVQYMAAADKAIKITPDILLAKWHGRSAEYMDMATEISAEAEARQTLVVSPQTMARRTGRDADREMKLSLEFVESVKKEMAARGLTNADFEIAFGPVNNRNAAAATAGKGTP
jgi:capsid protein